MKTACYNHVYILVDYYVVVFIFININYTYNVKHGNPNALLKSVVNDSFYHTVVMHAQAQVDKQTPAGCVLISILANTLVVGQIRS